MEQMTHEKKLEIQARLKEYVEKYGSQSKAANSMKDIASLGTINAILNGKFDSIRDSMFNAILVHINAGKEDDWQICTTSAYRDVDTLLEDAQQHQNVSWLTGAAGIGKTTTAKIYARSHKNVFYMGCSEDMHKADFVRDLATVIGIRTDGLKVREILNAISAELITMEKPLLIFDEGDKLTDSVMYYFITLYNALEDKCGIVFLSTPYIVRRMEKGLRLDKKGYDELHSRFCRRFVPITAITTNEVSAICRANGLNDDRLIDAVIRDSMFTRTANTVKKVVQRNVEFDMRRVKKAIHKQKRIAIASKL